MIKVYASIASVGFLVVASGVGCSSADTPDDGGAGTSSAGTSTTPTAGTPSVVPTGGTSSGGTGSGTAGTSTTPTAGTGTAGTGTVVTGAECKGIKSNMACPVEGTDCPGLACGLADSGVRACKCATNWTCSACDFSASKFKDKPATTTTCTTEADKLPCTTDGAVCEGAPGGEVCACAADDEGALIWDCDKAPTTWAAATQ
jgi:hypothetical protein